MTWATEKYGSAIYRSKEGSRWGVEIGKQEFKLGNVIYEIPWYPTEDVGWAVGYTNLEFKKEVGVREKYLGTVSLSMTVFKTWNWIRSLENEVAKV